MAQVTVIIPNWNGMRFIGHCLDSLVLSDFLDYDVIVVDNGSHDGSIDLIAREYPSIRCIEMGYNAGFAKACNAGIMATHSEFVCLLNNDVEVASTWLGALVKGLERHESCGMATSKMLFYDARDVINNAGDMFSIACKGGARGFGQKDVGQYDTEEYVFGACGGAALYRRAMLDVIGLFDEDFFAFSEDVDLNVRAQLWGYRCVYVPTAVVYHVGSATAGFHSDRHVSLFARNDLYVLLKNISVVNFVRYFSIIARARFELITSAGRAGQGSVVFRAWCVFAGYFWRMLMKRMCLRRRVSFSAKRFKEYITE